MLELRFMSLKYDSKDLIEDLIDNKILPKEQYISKADLIDRLDNKQLVKTFKNSIYRYIDKMYRREDKPLISIDYKIE